MWRSLPTSWTSFKKKSIHIERTGGTSFRGAKACLLKCAINSTARVSGLYPANVEIVENIACDDYACDDLIGAVGTVIDVNFDEPENVNGILNAKFCISFEDAYESTWELDNNNPNCRWVLENEIRLVAPIESFEDELLKLLGGNAE